MNNKGSQGGRGGQGCCGGCGGHCDRCGHVNCGGHGTITQGLGDYPNIYRWMSYSKNEWRMLLWE